MLLASTHQTSSPSLLLLLLFLCLIFIAIFLFVADCDFYYYIFFSSYGYRIVAWSPKLIHVILVGFFAITSLLYVCDTREMGASMCDVRAAIVVVVAHVSSVPHFKLPYSSFANGLLFVRSTRLSLLPASLFRFYSVFCSLANGVVMICDGVKNKFPWTTILFLICAFYFTTTLPFSLSFLSLFHLVIPFCLFFHRYS